MRESLGAALMIKGDAGGAEKTFRDDLDRNPRNPRSLYGLQQVLKNKGAITTRDSWRSSSESSWKAARPALKLEDLV